MVSGHILQLFAIQEHWKRSLSIPFRSFSVIHSVAICNTLITPASVSVMGITSHAVVLRISRIMLAPQQSTTDNREQP